MESEGFKHSKTDLLNLMKNISSEDKNGGNLVIKYSEFIAATLN
jgi:hypothetical protein